MANLHEIKTRLVRIRTLDTVSIPSMDLIPANTEFEATESKTYIPGHPEWDSYEYIVTVDDGETVYLFGDEIEILDIIMEYQND